MAPGKGGRSIRNLAHDRYTVMAATGSLFRLRSLVVVGFILWMTGTHAQSWELEQQLIVGAYDTTSHVEVALLNNVLVVGVSSAEGGHIELRQRQQGGLDQWGVLEEFDSPDPWFGFSLALRDGRLAVGAPGAAGHSGNVRLFGVDLQDQVDPLVDLGLLPFTDLLPDDRFGYSLAWLGDTLAVGAVGRTGFRRQGAVLLFAGGVNGSNAIGELPVDPDRGQVPFQRWFGTSITRSVDRLAVAASFTGFQESEPRENIGTVHVYHRDGATSAGWSLDTVLFDVTPRANPCVFFERVELGREGLAFMDDQLVVDHSSFYTGTTGDDLVPWRSHGNGVAGCPECALRIISNAGAWDMGTAVIIGQAPDQARSVEGWSAYDDRLFVNRYQSTEPNWETVIHQRDQGGANAWGILGIPLPEIDPCDVLSGPVVVNSGVLLRTSLRRDPGCDVPLGTMRLDLQIFQQQ